MRLSRFVVLYFTFFVGTSAVFAQKWSTNFDGKMRKGLHIGAVGSFNSVWITNQNNYGTLNEFNEQIVRQSEMDYLFTWGGNVGVELGYNFHKRWGIQIEPSFAWAGQKYDDDFLGPVAKSDATSPIHVPETRYVNVQRTVRLNYFQLPLMLKFQTRLDDRTNFFVMVGPQVGFLTSATEEVKVNYNVYDALRFTADQKFQKIDVGLALNLGLDIYPTDWLYISVGLPTYVGLTDINGNVLKKLEWYSKNDLNYQKSKNFRIGLQLGAHYFFNREGGY
jgi:hypothetical protein